MSQEVRTIELSKLRLWTENPRDPILGDVDDATIIHRAISNDSGNWNLDKMLCEIGDCYFYNDLPTVVKQSDETYIVYDGNRRIAVLKCIQNQELYSEATGKLATFTPSTALQNQTSLPCNVCDEETALDIVEKYHKSSGKWGMLEYETFLHIHRFQPKGVLMLLNEATGGIVESNPKLNEEYVHKRLLTNTNLNSIGFAKKDDELVTNHSNDEAISILEDIAEIRNKDITNSRKNPRRLKDALIELNPTKYKNIQPFTEDSDVHLIRPAKTNILLSSAVRRAPLKTEKSIIFGGSLRPRGNKSNQVYRAIEDIYRQYANHPAEKAYLLPIIGFSLRLLLETVAQEYYASQRPPIDKGVDTLKEFCKEVAKPHFRENSQNLLNQYALSSEWINDKINLEGVLGRWAHGTLIADNDTIIRHSKLIAEIIKELWWKD